MRSRRWARRLLRPHPPAPAGVPALFFNHIAKTGGTSFVRAMRTLVPPALQASENGDLSAEFVQRLAAEGLKAGQFIYGHPGSGAALPLRGRTCMTVVLREPREQAISNYLWIRQDWRLPDHAVAMENDLAGFLRARPYFAIFQTASMHVGIERRPLGRTEDLIDRLPEILEFLHEFELVGTTETEEALFRKACARLGLADPPRFPHHRKSRISPDQRRQMREQYAALEQDPQLGPLLQAERELYREAKLRADQACAEAAADRPGPEGFGAQGLARPRQGG